MGSFIFLVLIGLFFFWIFRSYRRFEQSRYSQKQFRHFTLDKAHLARSELGLFVALCAKVAKADGRVDELEAELIGNMFRDLSRLFGDAETARSLFKEIFNTEKQLRHNVDEIVMELYALIGHDAHKCRSMLSFWINLAFIDGRLTHAEETLLRKLAAHLHINPALFDAMMRQFAGGYTHTHNARSIDEAYATLGVQPSDSMETIKKAYRAKVKKYHPDIIKAQGASDAYIKEANEKVQQINAAYEQIKKTRA